jgi:hypothetical protein
VIHVSYGVTVYMSNFCRLFSLFSDSYRTEESDDIHAALALMLVMLHDMLHQQLLKPE